MQGDSDIYATEIVGAYNMSTLFVAYCSLNDIIVACKPSTTNKVRALARSSLKFSNDKRSCLSP